MHIPSERVYYKMNAEDASLWYVPATGDGELALLIKMTTPSIKALISGCSLNLIFGKHEAYLCIGAKIHDIPDSPVLISCVQKEAEEHHALIRALSQKKFPLFLFNEMDICLAWTNVELSVNVQEVLDFIGDEQMLYVGQFNDEVSHALDCFGYTLDNTMKYASVHTIPVLEISPAFECWRVPENWFPGNFESHAIKIDEKDEGRVFEQTIWASLESVFPLTLYKSPQIKVGEKMRELRDVFSFYTYGSFFIEAKDLSVLNAGYHRDSIRRTTGVQKQVKKAIVQLAGASRAFQRGSSIFDTNGNELQIDRTEPPHCIILITELMHCGDWKEIEVELINATLQAVC